MADKVGTALRSGWVKVMQNGRIRRRYLHLEASALCFLRTPTSSVKKRIYLCQIYCVHHSEPTYIELKLHSIDLFLIIDPPEECLAWMNAIMVQFSSVCKEEKISEIEDFRDFMQRIDEVLYTREAVIQAENEAIFSDLKKQVIDWLTELSIEEAKIYPLLHAELPATHTAFQRFSTAAGFASTLLIGCEQVQSAKVKVTLNRSMAKVTMQRAIAVGFVDPEEEVVRRSDTTRALKWKYSGMHFDAISFWVDRSVQLTAISVCTPIQPSASAVIEDLKILNGTTSHAPDYYNHGRAVELLQQNESTQRVQLRYPVRIQQDEFYTVLIRIKGKNTYKCVNCRDSHVGETGVHWRFCTTTFMNPHLSNKSDVTSGPIAALYYKPSS